MIVLAQDTLRLWTSRKNFDTQTKASIRLNGLFVQMVTGPGKQITDPGELQQ
jgi:hypothetical protein